MVVITIENHKVMYKGEKICDESPKGFYSIILVNPDYSSDIQVNLAGLAQFISRCRPGEIKAVKPVKN